jgi:hypothetical protein
MQPWPALVAEPPGAYEEHLQRGAAFHRLVHQSNLGLDHVRLEAMIHDADLGRWWQTYLRRPPLDLPEAVVRSEALLSAPMGGFRLLAKYDLLAAEPGERLVVVDWKTVRKRPERTTLARRMQTLVYRMLAVEAGAAFNGGVAPNPSQVEMVYWFAEFDGETECFGYDAAGHEASRAYLERLIAEIDSQRVDVWPLTLDERLCRHCNYRSLCDRGVMPGFADDLDDDLAFDLSDLEIDLQQIAEIEF